MPGNPFRTQTDVPKTALTPTKTTALRSAVSSSEKKVKRVQFVTPPSSPENVFEDTSGPNKGFITGSSPSRGDFMTVNAKTLLQADPDDDEVMEQQVLAMMAQQVSDKSYVSSKPPGNPFAKSAHAYYMPPSSALDGNQEPARTKMDVDAFTKMLMGDTKSRPERDDERTSQTGVSADRQHPDLGESGEATGDKRKAVPPPLPAARRSGPGKDIAAVETVGNHIALAPAARDPVNTETRSQPPPPPARRRRSSSKGWSITSIDANLAETNSIDDRDANRIPNDASHSSSSYQSNDTFTPDVLADLDALQREVDALRHKT